MSKKLVIIGASGHGKVIADLAKLNRYEQILFLDDNPALKTCAGHPVVGTVNDMLYYHDSDFVVAIGNGYTRQRIQERIEEAGLRVVSLIHPNAVIGSNVSIGNGTVIMAGTVINAETELGKGCIINTCASVDHECDLHDFVHVSVGAHVAGKVIIGEKTWVGAGATIINNLYITDNCMIGAGSVVVKVITESGIYMGVPARNQLQ